MKNVLKHLAKSVLPAVVSATNTAVQKNCWIGDEINYKRNNLLKIKDGAYVIILDEYKSIRTHWIALYVNGNILDGFKVEHICKKIKKFIGNKIS